MPNKTIYVKTDDTRLWADAQELAERTGRSVSELLADGLRLVLEKNAASVRRLPATAAPARTSSPLPHPSPNPFAARD